MNETELYCHLWIPFISQEYYKNAFTSGDGGKGMFRNHIQYQFPDLLEVKENDQ